MDYFQKSQPYNIWYSWLDERGMAYLVNCAYPSMKLRIIHELCQGFEIDLCDFFSSPLFRECNLEP